MTNSDLLEHIRTSVICPYAREAAKNNGLVFLNSPDEDTLQERFLEEIIKWFADPKETEKSLIVRIPQIEDNCEEEELERKFSGFYATILSHLLIGYDPTKKGLFDISTLILKEKFRENLERKEKIASIQPVGSQDGVLGLAMSPFYVESHPRYSPENCIVITDVGTNFKNKALPERISRGIRRSFMGRLGSGPTPQELMYLTEGMSTFFMNTSPENQRK